MIKRNYLLYIFITVMAFLTFNLGVKAESVAKIDDNFYETLEDAVNDSKEGDTITLVGDIDTTLYMTAKDAVVLEFKRDMTLDLNNHTINTYNMNLIYTGINLTIKNGYFTTSGSYALFIGDEPESDNVLVDNVKTTGGINIFNATNVTLKDVDAVGQKYYAVWADQHALINILSGNYSTKGNFVLGITKEESSYIHIMGGKYTTTNGNLVLGSNYKPPVIYGGIFDSNPEQYKHIDAKIKVLDDGNYEVYSTTIEITEESEEGGIKIVFSDDAATLKTIYKMVDKLNIFKSNKVVLDSNLITLSDEEKEKIDEVINSSYNGAIISDYLDININVKDILTDTIISNITELDEKIKIKVLLSDDLINKDSKILRKYYVARKHGDVIDIINTTCNGNVLEFLSDKFSTYVIFYVDSKINKPSSGSSNTLANLEKNEEKPIDKENNDDKIDENPNTNDNIVTNIELCLSSIVIGTLAFKFFRKSLI
ncbi:MAG: hypothetical protein NC548_37505 [Lachnospiraceae bacterium]|nr:hypothetical protein [Lachnospiraceae bacterium]